MDPEEYEAMLMAINVTDIIEMVEAIKDLGLPGETSVYDMGCGTGLIGIKLHSIQKKKWRH